MTNISKQLTAIVSATFEAAGYDAKFGAVETSNRPDLCQFQCNGALAAAKQYKTNPVTIAEAVAAAVNAANGDLNIEAVKPGFLNIRMSDERLAAQMSAIAADARLGLPTVSEPKTIVLDYGGPNTAKHLHVGHLRSAVIGDTLNRIAAFLGNKVISDVHLGDWGLPMGLVIAQMLEDGIADRVETHDAERLNAIYPAASARSKEDETFLATAQEITRELQQGNEEYYKIWQKLRDVSVSDAKPNYDALNLLAFDYWYGESDAQPYVERVIDGLRAKGLLKEDDGAQIVELKRDDDKEPIPPVIVVRRNGSEAYATTDLATIIKREQDFKPDEMWYFTDARQGLYFKQVFRCAKMAGFSGAAFSHIVFGTVNGADGKPFKTRSGGVMRLCDMIAEVRAKLPDPKVASAAMRIADLQNHPVKDVRFDVDKFTASEGKTGPYLQYTAVRIGSILSKADVSVSGNEQLAFAVPKSASERLLMLSLDSVGDALLRAFTEKAPNALCEALFDIAARFNTFYGEHRMLSEPDEVQRTSWLALLRLTRRVLETLLDLLGVDVPERM